MVTLTVEVRQKAKTGRELQEAVYLVKDEMGRDIGMLVKWRNTRTDRHPWKAFGPLVNSSEPRKFLGAFYGPNGKRDALQAVASTL